MWLEGMFADGLPALGEVDYVLLADSMRPQRVNRRLKLEATDGA
jgi:hypothetical protein